MNMLLNSTELYQSQSAFVYHNLRQLLR